MQVRLLPRALLSLSLAMVVGRPAFGQDPTGQQRVAAMQADLRRLVTAEEAYFADRAKYTTDLAELAPYFRPGEGAAALNITLTADGWTAVLRYTGTRTFCVAYVGSTPIPPATAEGKPVCQAGGAVPTMTGPGSLTDTAAVRAAIDSGNARWIAAFGQGDAAGVTALFAPDGVQFRGSGAVVRGRAAIQTSYVALFRDNGRADATIATSRVWLVDDRAYETGRFRFTFHPAGRPPVTNSGRYVTIWRRQLDGSWRIVVDFGVPSDTTP
jgi:uncharacterized protein (TIGR02246 family)